MATNPNVKPTEEQRLSDISGSYEKNYVNNNEKSSISRPRPSSSRAEENSMLAWFLVAIVVAIAAIIAYSWYKNIGSNIPTPNPAVNNAGTSNNTSGTANPSSDNTPANPNPIGANPGGNAVAPSGMNAPGTPPAATGPANQNNQTNSPANQNGTPTPQSGAQ